MQMLEQMQEEVLIGLFLSKEMRDNLKRIYTQEQYEFAKQVDLLEYVKKEGYQLIKAGNSYRLKEHDSLVISNNKWNWFSQGIGGTIIEFLTKYENLSLVDAILKLNNESFINSNYRNEVSCKNNHVNKKKEFKIPVKDYDNNIVFNYLTQKRLIDSEIVNYCIEKKMIYQTRDIKACAFVGFDSKNKVKHISLRGTDEAKYYKDVYGSLKSYTFKLIFDSEIPISTIYVFESPIDALSHATILKMQGLNYREQSRITLGGVGYCALDKFLRDNASIEKIILCLDNDKTGIETMNKFSKKYLGYGYRVEKMIPYEKDYNELLKTLTEFKE